MEQLLNELEKIYREHDHKIAVMASALKWGYSTARTNMVLEMTLRGHFNNNTLFDYVKELAEGWNGQQYIAGALRYANNSVKTD